jgi:IS1 family transposase
MIYILTMLSRFSIILIMNKLDNATRSRVIGCLVEGNSIRSTVRMTGISMPTILKLLAEIGEVCREYQDQAFHNLSCRRLQVDEIWQYCYAKEKNVPEDRRGALGYGDIWTWVAIDADTKLVPAWLVGRRDTTCAVEFITDLAARLSHRVQLTSDGHRSYLVAVEAAFGSAVDYAMLIKEYGTPQEETRYSPAECIGITRKVISGRPDGDHISTSYIERQNLTMRMSMRRFTRLTNGFSKKLENHAAAIALHYMHYNFCRIHKTLRVTPAMAAGVTDHVWEISEIVALLEAKERAA